MIIVLHNDNVIKVEFGGGNIMIFAENNFGGWL